MKYKHLGRTGVKVSCIGLGTAAFGVAPLAEKADTLVGRALDLGINLFDTANSYGNQTRFDRTGAPPANARKSSEEILGRALKSNRHDVVLCTKVMEPVGDGANDAGLSRLHIFQQVESSLKRLGTDHIDIYYAHHPDPTIPIGETIQTFADLIRQGKIRYYALSTFSAWEMTEALWASDKQNISPPPCNQLSYSLANRTIEQDVVPACERFGVTIMAFSPLGGGLLAGDEALKRSVIGAKRWGYPGFSNQQLALANEFNSVAKQNNVPPAQLAVAWVTSSPVVGSAIVGAESVQEMEAITAAATFNIDGELSARLDEIGKPSPRNWY